MKNQRTHAQQHPFVLILALAGLISGTTLFSGSREVVSAQTAGPSWTYTGNLNTARNSHTATLLPNGKVLVAGGNDDGDLLNSAELYDPATGTWSYTGNLNTARRDQTATLLPNGKVLVAGGYGTNGQLNSAEQYDPATGTWSITGNLNTAHDSHTATLLPNGKVLVAGGYGTNGQLNSAELYDPATGTWSITGNLNTARDSHTATLLPNGKVLIAAGFSNSRNSAELYDPATGTWSTTGNLNTGRDSHTATLLHSGKVLVGGGLEEISISVSTARSCTTPPQVLGSAPATKATAVNTQRRYCPTERFLSQAASTMVATIPPSCTTLAPIRPPIQSTTRSSLSASTIWTSSTANPMRTAWPSGLTRLFPAAAMRSVSRQKESTSAPLIFSR